MLNHHLQVHGEVAAWEADVLQKGIHEPVVLSVGDFVGEAALAVRGLCTIAGHRCCSWLHEGLHEHCFAPGT